MSALEGAPVMASVTDLSDRLIQSQIRACKSGMESCGALWAGGMPLTKISPIKRLFEDRKRELEREVERRRNGQR